MSAPFKEIPRDIYVHMILTINAPRITIIIIIRAYSPSSLIARELYRVRLRLYTFYAHIYIVLVV